MLTLIFATNNQNKIKEISSILGNAFTLLSLKDAGIEIDIPEPWDTLEDNAKEKSGTIEKLTQQNCFSEDTGLEVEALNGEPGVKSARYAGDDANAEKNIDKLPQHLKDSHNRNARFRTVISLEMQGKNFLFEGICKGKITHAKNGNNGFGYDPVFVPDGASKTFAAMDIDEKNRYSHRKKALEKLIVFLKENYGKA